ncbi:MAG TPA: SDR family oxidoreductase [Polynucleobacter sp.]|jgi:3-oxoacyl-[acyl-carrier protein] reductase|nr:MAG: 3-oxoacyl-ACP reductase [Polynucleobacter sp. 16-46-70]HQR83302.1 SDR family oxidoreductase [Polynucleobacter sp.]HQS60205.1 SDR family oxidoreductase [Polynucleobacter sp.]HQT20423.1 SDR family oxidoreductase [Polynucleobacter sp.]HQT40610.1 SDR family oxidoreductase [Polynucleobacter sp.]
MNLGLNGKVALVLASSRGLGQAMAVSLAREGVKVAVTGRNPAGLQKSVELIEAAGGKALALSWDLSDLKVIDNMVSQVEQELGPIDILINNTGGPPPTPAAGQDPALWQKSFNDMILSLITITDRVLPGMRQRKWGRIITSTTSGAISPIKNLAISNTLRAALLAWSKTLSAEVAQDGVTVNVIMPGRVATDRLRELDEARAKRENLSYEDVVKLSLQLIPAGRYGDPQEYGDTAAFLASQNASFITGSVIRVDGGQIPAV